MYVRMRIQTEPFNRKRKHSKRVQFDDAGVEGYVYMGEETKITTYKTGIKFGAEGLKMRGKGVRGSQNQRERFIP